VTILVPRGAEAAAVRRAHTAAQVIELRAGRAAAGTLSAMTADDPCIVLGLCGALRELRAGDVVVYRSVAFAEHRTALDADLAAALAARVPGARLADACTTDHVVTSMRERAELAERYGADVVDMEGSTLADALASRNQRFAMIRVVSDDATRDLPALEGAIRADGRLDIARIAYALLRRPRAALAFVRNVRLALRTLTLVAEKLES
jgi:adenosylhomocysteine nucleosidase